jgi:outer membrane PBP1 activator LpoA protein
LLRQSPDLELDGVTGRIRLSRDQHYIRELPAAQFIDGKTVISGASR